MLKDNFSEIQLLSESPVWFYLQDNGIKVLEPIVMRIPTIKQVLTDPYLQLAIALLNMPNKTLKDSIPSIEFNNLWELLNKIRQIEPGNTYSLHIEYLFKLCFREQFSITSRGWTIQGILIDNDWFDRIVDIILIACSLKKFSEQSSAQTHKPKWLIEKEEEIRRIKSQGKTTSNMHSEYNELLKVLIPLNYELGYSLEELFNMNYFHIHALSTFIPKIVGYDVSKRAVFSKQKIKYIIDK